MESFHNEVLLVLEIVDPIAEEFLEDVPSFRLVNLVANARDSVFTLSLELIGLL